MATWYPSVKDYFDWSQEQSFLSSFKNSPDKTAIAIRLKIDEQTNTLTKHSHAIVASNSQVEFAVNEGLYRLQNIMEDGLRSVSSDVEDMTSAIEQMQSVLEYELGVISQRIEIQNQKLSEIIDVLKAPYNSKVLELYNSGCTLIKQGLLDLAKEYLERSLTIPTGDIYFPAYYRLGRIYLYGRGDGMNITNVKKANEVLLLAHRLAKGIYNTDPNFRFVLADCKFFVSLSYYCQLRGKHDSTEQSFLNHAIRFAKEAIDLNPNLSQAFYHLAKYYAYQDNKDLMLESFSHAIRIDRNYTLTFLQDGIFRKHKQTLLEHLDNIRRSNVIKVQLELDKIRKGIEQLEKNTISKSKSLSGEFQKLKQIFLNAEMDYRSNTYIGIDDCRQKIFTLLKKIQNLLDKRITEIQEQTKLEKIAISERIEKRRREIAELKRISRIKWRIVIVAIIISLPIGWFVGSAIIAAMSASQFFKSPIESRDYLAHLDSITPYFQGVGIVIVFFALLLWAYFEWDYLSAKKS